MAVKATAVPLALLGLLALVSCTRARPSPTTCPRLQTLVDGAAAGDTVRVPACLYRESVRVEKPVRLVAEPGAEIRGSDVWADWTRRGPGLWAHHGLPETRRDGECRGGGDDCLSPHQVFLDGQALREVGGRPVAGQFAVEDDQVLLAEDPAGRSVEVSTRGSWIVGAADGVTIQGFTMRHAANPPQRGAITNAGASAWTIRENVLSDSHGPAVSFDRGRGHRLVGNRIARSGQLGVHGSDAEDVVVEANVLHGHNTEGFDPGWEAGGLKMSGVSRLRVIGNEVEGNDGPGLWCDVGCRDVEIARNRVRGNGREGIAYEISQGGRIHHNDLWENGWERAEWGLGAGILCQNCADTEIHDNILAWNARGISVVEQRRDVVGRVTGVRVRANTVLCDARGLGLLWLSDAPGRRLFAPDSGNLGEENAASCPGPAAFAWDDRELPLERFAATPGGAGTRSLDEDERGRVLQARGLPPSPSADR